MKQTRFSPGKLVLLAGFILLLGIHLPVNAQYFTHCNATVGPNGNTFVFTFGFEGEALHFQIGRINGFDPCNGETPENDGTFTLLGTAGGGPYVDNSFSNMPPQFVAFAVRARLNETEYTPWCYSNYVFKGHYAVTIDLEYCDGGHYTQKSFTLTATDVCDSEYTLVKTAYYEAVEFSYLMPGTYSLQIEFDDFYSDIFIPALEISSDTSIIIQAGQDLLPVVNLAVDTANLIAAWEAPGNLAEAYVVMVNGEEVGTTTQTELQLPCIDLNNDPDQLTVFATYSCGVSTGTSTYFRSGYLPAPSDLQFSMTYGVNQLMLSWDIPQRCDLEPAYGMTDYQIFINGQLNQTVSADNFSALIEGLSPGVYNIRMRALYDLAAYGLSGQGISVYSDPLTIVISNGMMLPSTTAWQPGLFTDQGWQADEPHWTIESSQRASDYYALFKPVPDQTDLYGFSLTSDLMLTQYKSFLPIKLSCDIKLQSANHTGNEMLIIQIKYPDNSSINLDALQNTSSFDWQTYTWDISSHITDKNIHIAFMAIGGQSADIDGWYIDNIRVYEECREPAGLSGSQIDENVRLQWTFDEAGIPYTFKGFKIYRRDQVAAEYIQIGFVPYSAAPKGQFQFDDNNELQSGMEYHYMVRSYYSSDIDYCESPGAKSLDNPQQDWVSVTFVGLNSLTTKGFQLFPNPASKSFTVHAANPITALSIMNLQGRELYSIVPDGNSNTFTIDIQNYAPGTYMVQLVTNNQRVYSKLIVR
ncbi:MAG: T9SS type A sorting domain-containing protein [Bacteroidales bacterium]|nr:T9SS type A sorting domain-containing protein [Bacteroidales bacterium]